MLLLIKYTKSICENFDVEDLPSLMGGLMVYKQLSASLGDELSNIDDNLQKIATSKLCNIPDNLKLLRSTSLPTTVSCL